MDHSDLDISRFMLLVRQVGDEHGRLQENNRRWQARVAERLNVSSSIISKLHTGTRNSVGRKTMMKALRAMRMDPAWYTRPLDEEPHYSDFQSGGRYFQGGAPEADAEEDQESSAELDESDRASLWVLQEREGPFTEAELAFLRGELRSGGYAKHGVQGEVELLSKVLRAFRKGKGMESDGHTDDDDPDTGDLRTLD